MWYVILIPLLPAVAALLVAVGPRRSEMLRARIGVWPTVLSFVLAIVALVMVSAQGPVTVRFYDVGDPANPVLPMGFLIDRLSTVMMVLIGGISTLIYLYSMRYLQQERGYARFLSLMILTIVVLQCMVASANLMMLFVFWQLLSFVLYILAHRHEHGPTLRGAFTTFTLLRLADVAFLSGIVLAQALYGTLEFQELFARAAATPVTLSPLPGLEISGPTAVTLLIFIGAMGKSAQFPIHMWLPGSLYAPTPVHALLHAGIINAGGFLLNRLAPLYGLSPSTLHVVFVVGMLTAILGACMMLVQNDIKKTLGFSTIGQMGYMIMECGLGAFALAVFHLVAHGLFKATVFLNCGNVIHKARQEPAFPHRAEPVEEVALPHLTWITGFLATLVLPLSILLAAHGVLRIPLLESHGTVIFLFFAWVTSSQAILSLTRLRAVASWKVSAAMLLTLLLVIFTYLFAAETFTAFLYPDPAEVERYFQAAALPGRLFEGLGVGAILLTILSWFVVYAKAHGRTVRMPAWMERVHVRLYVLFMNRLYVDAVYHRLGQWLMRAAHRLDKLSLGRLP